MVEMNSSSTGSPKEAVNHIHNTVVVMPIANGSPSASEMRRRRRRKSRLMSSSSSVISAAAAAISSDDKHKISNIEALVHLVKATIGGGFLAMPEAFHHAGLVVGSIGTIILGMSVLNMMATIVRCSQALRSGKYAAAILAEKNEKDDDKNDKNPPTGGPYSKELLLPPMDYPDTVAAVFEHGSHGRFARWGPFFRYCTSTSLVATYYGVNIIYVCIVANTCKQLVDQYTAHAGENSWASLVHGLSIHWYPAVTAVLIVPVGMIRLIKYLVPFSIAANACLMAGAGAVFYFIFIAEDTRSPLRPDEQASLFVWPATGWSLFAGSALCSLEGVGMLMHIENAMQRPLELVGPPTYTLHQSMFIIILLNGLLGFFGYLKYGNRCAGSVSLNLPSGNRLSESVKVMIALGILLTYGLQLTVTADLAWQALRKKLTKHSKGSVADECTEEEKNVDDEEFSPRLTAYYYAMRFSLILGTILVATVVPDIGPLVSLVGSVGFSMLGLIVPVIMETVWYWHPNDDDGDGEEQDCRIDDIIVAENSDRTTNGGGGTAITASGVKKLPSKMINRRFVRRTVRHIKNIIVISIALCAMVGGAYFNIRDILTQKSGDDTPPSSDV